MNHRVKDISQIKDLRLGRFFGAVERQVSDAFSFNLWLEVYTACSFMHHSTYFDCALSRYHLLQSQ